MEPMVLASGAVAGAGVVAMSVAARRWRTRPDVDPFFEGVELTDDKVDYYALRTAEPFHRRAARIVSHAFVRRLEGLLPAHYLAGVHRRLLLAGLRDRRPAAHLATQLTLGALFGVAALALSTAGLSGRTTLALWLMPVIGFVLPAVRLSRAARTRSEAIFKDLPDTLDLLAIAVEAGTGFEGAVAVVCQHFRSPLADELGVLLRGMQLGISRREALQDLRRRVDLPEMRNFVVAMLQADALGIPVARVLKSQATELRARRRSWAREKAAKLPVKILFPLVLFIFPPVFAVVLGPAAPGLLHL